VIAVGIALVQMVDASTGKPLGLTGSLSNSSAWFDPFTYGGKCGIMASVLHDFQTTDQISLIV